MSDYETAQRKRDIIVGIFVIVAMCALVWLIFMFEGLPRLLAKRKSFKVKVQFATAPGVDKGTAIQFCGRLIGEVTDVKAPEICEDLNTHQKYHQTVVVLSIKNDYNDIPADVEVKLIKPGFGSSYIELKARAFDVKEPQGPFLVDGNLLQGSTKITSEFFPEESQEKLDELVSSLGTLITNANDILGDPNNKENLRTTLANLSEMTKRAKQTVEEAQKFFVAGTSASEQLSKTVSELRLILEKVNSGQGTAAKFVNDGRLYENLLENTEQMQMLLQELKSFTAEWRGKGILIKLK